MKKIAAIALILIFLAGIGLFAFLYITKEELIFAGNVSTDTAQSTLTLTRAYVSDANEVANVRAILDKINNEAPAPTSDDIVNAIVENGKISFAPTFYVKTEQATQDFAVFSISGASVNGLNSDGTEAVTDYRFDGLHLEAASENLTILSATNLVNPTALERKEYTLPVLGENRDRASFDFSDTNGFEMLFTIKDAAKPAKMTLVFSYDIKAATPLNFTELKGEILQLEVELSFSGGTLNPTYTAVKANVQEQE